MSHAWLPTAGSSLNSKHGSYRQWCRKFGPEYARKLRHRQGRLGDIWYLDEVFVKIRGVMRDGLSHGPYEWYYANTQLRERGTYKDGEKHGLVETYHSNGQLQTKCNFKDGLPHGHSEMFDENGQLMARGNWHMDKECGEWIEYGRTVTHPPC
jgi:hypothetical protein